MSTEIYSSNGVSITADPKVKTAEDAKNLVVGFMKNPPQNPLEFIAFAADMTGVGAALTLAVGAMIPGGALIMPMLSGILSMFGGGGPTVGELTLKAIANLSQQINQIAEQIKTALKLEIQISAQRVIDVVLAGQTEVARQQSAAQVFISTIQAEILDQAAIEKQQAYTDFLTQSQAMQNEAMASLQKMLQDAQALVDAEFTKQMQQIILMIQDLMGDFLSMLDGFLTPIKTPAPAAVSRSVPILASAPPANNAPAESASIMPFLLLGAVGLLFLMKRKKR